MQIRSIIICSLAFIASGCSKNSTDVAPKSSNNISERPASDLNNLNLFNITAFEESNADLLSPSRAGYLDADSASFVALKAGTYTSKVRSALRVCAVLKASNSNPAISIRGKNPKSSLTAMLIENNSRVDLKQKGDAGDASLRNGRLCVTSAPSLAGSTMVVFVFPAMSTDSIKYEKSAVGELEIRDVSVSWVEEVD